MCRVYNTIGCLHTIQFELVKNRIDEFNFLNELIDFQKNYDFKKQKIISEHNKFINEEIEFLENELSELDLLISQKPNDLKQELRQKLDNLNQQIEELPETNSKIIPVLKDYWLNLIIHINFGSYKSYFLSVLSFLNIVLKNYF